MQILFVSNYYPPYSNGGYEQLCEETARELAQRGHHVTILTSRTPSGPRSDESNGVQVRRLLHLEVDSGLIGTTRHLLFERQERASDNLTAVRAAIDELQPDAALVWGMWNVPRQVPALVERLLPGRVVYYFCDYWPSLPSAYVQQWQEPARRKAARLPKRVLGRLVLALLTREPAVMLRLERPVCVSRAVRNLLVQTGVPIEHAAVVHLGIPVSQFAASAEDHWQVDGPLKLLYVGRLSPEKGVHTAIRAMALLEKEPDAMATLEIVGAGSKDYERELRAQVQRLGLEITVVFRGRVPRSSIPTILGEHHVLIFPSEWEEPFAHVVLEAMAAGLVVVGTTTGGTGEILDEDKTGLTFPAGNAEGLALQIRRLVDDPSLGRQMATTARQLVGWEYSLTRTIDELEAILRDAAFSACGQPTASTTVEQR